MRQNIVIFGASTAGENAFKTLGAHCSVLGFCDNDKAKQGQFFCGHPILAPDQLPSIAYDKILIASCYAREILEQLLRAGIPRSKIDYSDVPPDLAIYADWREEHSRRLNAFRNIHAGKDCFIVGNGPSLNKTNLEALNDYYTFGLNKIYLLFDRSAYRPTYHVSINKYVIEQTAHEVQQFPFPSFVSYRYGRGIVESSPRLFFIHTGTTITFSKDITETVQEGGTVTFAAMQLAYFMGFKRVFLVGVDHSFATQGKANEKQVMGASDPNHFDPRYFAHQEWQLPDLQSSEYAYNLAKDAFAADGREIQDATVGGKLTIFPKLDYTQALKMARPKVD